MPFTPFHMGPGILIKALLQSSFSVMIFGWAQIIMDIEPFYPWLLPNKLLGIITTEQLHKLCLYSGLIGACLYYLAQFFTKKYIN